MPDGPESETFQRRSYNTNLGTQNNRRHNSMTSFFIGFTVSAVFVLIAFGVSFIYFAQYDRTVKIIPKELEKSSRKSSLPNSSEIPSTISVETTTKTTNLEPSSISPAPDKTEPTSSELPPTITKELTAAISRSEPSTSTPAPTILYPAPPVAIQKEPELSLAKKGIRETKRVLNQIRGWLRD
ncbi:Extensin-like [Caenorhabditis elegans]|uniref:Extensin-like n=1 Tax=Caenorhabditis elegans TaxID=6239 RepID=O62373_CAEEL|nr:Extensin-like [Caenorhabditis elegans]CAB05802.1 Extensin-like [Caenorhabditis elegans]|eukprot:NP_506738.1 Uncharacterized protein CELE_T09F5.2 [Caenorhabditis elegans]